MRIVLTIAINYFVHSNQIDLIKKLLQRVMFKLVPL